MRVKRLSRMHEWLGAVTLSFLCAHPAYSQACTAQSGNFVPPVVELYTSEGCNSCPPADQWLSRLKQDAGVVALAFHVDYWDRLGWRDRFASAAYTDRQSREQLRNGATFSYTPQVVLNGMDHKRWHRDVIPSGKRSTILSLVDVVLKREGDQATAVVTARPAAPTRMSAYWAVTEDNHLSFVKAGENKGVTLRHDFVVRRYVPVAEWNARDGLARPLAFKPGKSDPDHPQTINLVVVDAQTGHPLQAVKLRC